MQNFYFDRSSVAALGGLFLLIESYKILATDFALRIIIVAWELCSAARTAMIFQTFIIFPALI